MNANKDTQLISVLTDGRWFLVEKDNVDNIGLGSVIETAYLTELVPVISGLGPAPVGAKHIIAGKTEIWCGDLILRAPNLVEVLQNISRRRVVVSNLVESYRTVAVRQTKENPIVLMPPSAIAGAYCAFWIKTLPDQRWRSVPKDMQLLLTSLGIPIDVLSERSRRQFIAMLREAKSSEVRNARLDGIREALLASDCLQEKSVSRQR